MTVNMIVIRKLALADTLKPNKGNISQFVPQPIKKPEAVFEAASSIECRRLCITYRASLSEPRSKHRAVPAGVRLCLFRPGPGPRHSFRSRHHTRL